MAQRSERPRLYSLAWVFYLLMALAGVAWVGWRGDLGPAYFVDPRTWWRDLAYGVAGGLALIGAWALARRFFAAARRVEAQIGDLLGDLAADEVFALAVISGVAEEIFFRGGVQGSWGWVWATALFAALHTGPGRHFRMWTLFALLAGLLFAGLTSETGNLLAAIVAHGLVNGVNLRLLVRRRAARTLDPAGREEEGSEEE